MDDKEAWLHTEANHVADLEPVFFFPPSFYYLKRNFTLKVCFLRGLFVFVTSSLLISHPTCSLTVFLSVVFSTFQDVKAS